MTRPEVSVLLTSWNTREDTRRCLATLRETAEDVAYEVIAVDNGSVDGSVEVLEADPAVRLIRNERNVGFARAVNQGYREAGADLLLLLNSDIVFHPGALRAMVTYLDDHPEVAGVSPLYLNPDGTFQQHYVQLPSYAACIALWTVLKRAPYFRGQLHRFQMKGEDFSRPRELSSASCMLLRAKVVGPDAIFDEHFPVYWNDALLTRDLMAAGHHMWMIPEAVVTHDRGASCRLLGPAMRFRHLLGGLVRYLEITEPAHRVRLFRLVLMADYLLKTACGRTTTLAWSDLRAALRGDVGPLPDGDTRGWEVVGGDPDGVPPDDGTVRRLLLDGRGGHRARRFEVRHPSPATWQATLPTPVPVLTGLAPVRWINQRVAAARVRVWLDRQSGERTLRVDADHEFLVGRLGEDVLATVETDALHREMAGG